MHVHISACTCYMLIHVSLHMMYVDMCDMCTCQSVHMVCIQMFTCTCHVCIHLCVWVGGWVMWVYMSVYMCVCFLSANFSIAPYVKLFLTEPVLSLLEILALELLSDSLSLL